MASKKIYRSRGYLDQILFTGAIVHGARLSTPDGWVRLSGLTIGSSTSGSTERANDDCEDLFKLLWNDCTDTECPVVGGRGVSADADWSANKQITLWDCRNEVLAGLDYNNGIGLSNRLTISGSGINGEILGNYGGLQNHTLSLNELVAHSHSLTGGVTDSSVEHSHSVSGTAALGGVHSHLFKFAGYNTTTQTYLYTDVGSGSSYSGNWGIDLWNPHDFDGGNGDRVYINNSSSHTHTVSGNSGPSGSHSHTVSGTISGTGMGLPHNNTQPTRIANLFIKL
jgi:microcystin-dependent protein